MRFVYIIREQLRTTAGKEDVMAIGTRHNGTKHVVFGILAGGALGAALALLYAPEKGKKLRADLAKKSTDLLEGTRDTVDSAVGKASETLSRVKRGSDKLFDGAKKSVDVLADKTSHLLRHN